MGFNINWSLMKSFLAELLCTALFGFVIYGVIINTLLTNNLSTRTIILGLAAGFSAVGLIYTFMDITLAHFNPAITFGAMLARKLPILKGLGYILAQFVGALLAVGLVYLAYPNDTPNESISQLLTSERNPNANVFRAMAMEFVLTFILVYVAFATAIGVTEPPTLVRVEVPDRDSSVATLDSIEQGKMGPENLKIFTTLGSARAGFAPIAIGLTIGFLAVLGGASSGGTFNPALALAPTLISGYWSQIYIYLVGEFLGGAVASLLHTWVFARKYVDDEM